MSRPPPIQGGLITLGQIAFPMAHSFENNFENAIHLLVDFLARDPFARRRLHSARRQGRSQSGEAKGDLPTRRNVRALAENITGKMTRCIRGVR